MTKSDQVLQRALSMLGRHTVYWAGAGGTDPQASSPVQQLEVGRLWPHLPAAERAQLEPLALAAGFNVHDPALVLPACDCSGFVCWALGLPRSVQHGAAVEWINTDSIHADAMGPNRRFLRTAKAAKGGIVVYPKRDSGERYGHVAIITEVDASGHARSVIHCSATNFMEPPFDAILSTPPEAFDHQPLSIYAWCLGVEPSP